MNQVKFDIIKKLVNTDKMTKDKFTKDVLYSFSSSKLDSTIYTKFDSRYTLFIPNELATVEFIDKAKKVLVPKILKTYPRQVKQLKFNPVHEPNFSFEIEVWTNENEDETIKKIKQKVYKVRKLFNQLPNNLKTDEVLKSLIEEVISS